MNNPYYNSEGYRRRNTLLGGTWGVKMKTCCSLNCPLIPYCKEYNFLVDRGNKCEIQKKIIEAAKKAEKHNRKDRCRQ